MTFIGGHWEWQEVTVYSTYTVTLDSLTGIAPGSTITISGDSALNGSNLLVISVDPATNTLKLGYGGQDAVSGAGGTATITAPTLNRNADTVTANTVTPHGLNPGDMFNLSGVANTALGGGISSAVRANNIITITTAAPNGVRVGSSVLIGGVGDASFDGTWDVTAALSAKSFQVTSSNLVDATSSGGTVSDIWNNTQRFVVSVPTPTSLTYAEAGPDDQTTGAGTITPVGQLAGGVRSAVLMFQTDSGFVTPPSVPVRIVIAGGKKLYVTNIPVGPGNVIARILAFTGVDGGSYFYIPVPARDNGNAISTSTVINDNTSTSAILDFSDETLLSALAIDIPGNDLFSLRALGNCAGVEFYADRLLYWGAENIVENFQNMGFEGGVDIGGAPLGWTVNGVVVMVTNVADFGIAMQIPAGSNAIISQTAYLDYYGDPIIEPNTLYNFKCWIDAFGDGIGLVAEFYDTATGISVAGVTMPIISNSPGFREAQFSAKTPAIIPPTMVLRVFVTNNTFVTVTIDEMKVIFADNPNRNTEFAVSYINNPESVDGLTGKLGASADPAMIMDAGRLRDNLYFVTQGRLHTTKDQANAEPSEWDVNEIADRCGGSSMMSMISGESWLSWVSGDGARMFDGSEPKKITQDIQQLFDAVPANSRKYTWAVNDTANRRMYWGLAPDGGPVTDSVIMLDYRYGESGADIENRDSVRVSPYTGKMLVLELSRKFSPWSVPATAGSLLATLDGNALAFSDGLGRTYTLDPDKFQDDDYGTIPAYYVTSPFVAQDMEQQLQLGVQRHLFTYMTVFISGTGKISITPLADALSNAYPARGPYPLKSDPTYDMEFPLNVAARRAFFKIIAQPVTGSQDAAFNLSRMTVTMIPHPMSPIRGAQ